MQTTGPIVKHLESPAPTSCPCGQAFRIITAADNDQASIHVVEIRDEAKRHYHQHHTEFYYCLEGAGKIELDDKTFEMTPGTAVMIPPGIVHAARGRFRIVNVVIPPLDPADEYVVE